MTMEIIIETKKLTKRYGKVAALNNLDLTVTKGEVLGYLGPNGAGKTTTIRLLLGLARSTSGSARPPARLQPVCGDCARRETLAAPRAGTQPRMAATCPVGIGFDGAALTGSRSAFVFQRHVS